MYICIFKIKVSRYWFGTTYYAVRGNNATYE